MDRGLGDRPGKIVERAKGAEMIRRSRRTGNHDREVRHDCAPRRRGEKEKEKRKEGERQRIKIKRQIDDGPVEIVPPENALNGKAAKTAHRDAVAGAELAADSAAVCLVASGAKTSRRFVSSARHQWKRPF